jgi:uncharacterized SAM-binding protein YcdF (DUF218 family)
MAAYAARLGVPAERIGLETRSRSTWENFSMALPMVETYDSIAIASDPLHAARARRYALQQRADLSSRLVFADNYRFLERWWLKVPTAAYELFIASRQRFFKAGPLTWPRRSGFGADLSERVTHPGGVVGEQPLEEQNQSPYK